MPTAGLVDALYQVSGKDKSDEQNFGKACFKVYRKFVKTYQDLLITNLAFLHGMFMTFYSYYVGLDVTHSGSGVTNTLVQLHEHGFFTINGQGNACDADYRERSYVDALFPKSMYHAVVAELKKRDAQIFYVVSLTEGGVMETNLDPGVFTDVYEGSGRMHGAIGLALTQGKYEGKTAWQTDSMLFQSRVGRKSSALMDAEDGLPHVAALLVNELYQVTVVVRDFCSPLLADKVLLDCALAAGFPVIQPDPFQRMRGGYSHNQKYFGV